MIQDALQASQWELLLSYLSAHQRRTFCEHGFFYVRSDGNVYALVDGWSVWVVNLVGKIVTRWQAAPADDAGLLCVDDRLLGQLLVLETNVRYFKDRACRMPFHITNDNMMWFQWTLPQALLDGTYLPRVP